MIEPQQLRICRNSSSSPNHTMVVARDVQRMPGRALEPSPGEGYGATTNRRAFHWSLCVGFEFMPHAVPYTINDKNLLSKNNSSNSVAINSLQR